MKDDVFQLIAIGMQLLELGQKIAASLKQSGEWTAADDKKLDDKIAALKTKEYWQPEKKS